MTRRAIVLACAATLLLAAAPARAADWDAEGFITPPGEASFELDGAVDAAGNAFFAWRGPLHTGPGPGPTTSDFRYRARLRGGPFGDIRTLPADNEEPTEIAGAANGDVVMAWRERTDSQSLASPSRVLKAAIRPAGGGFGNAQTIYEGDPAGSVCWVNTGIAPNGEAVVLFGVTAEAGDVGRCLPHAAVRRPGEDRFGDAMRISDVAADYRPQIAFDGQGNALVAWRGPNTTTVKVARHGAGAGFEQLPDVAVTGETVPRLGGPLVLRVSQPTGRAILGFPTTADGDRVRVGGAVGSVAGGFNPGEVLSGPADLSSGQLGSYFDGGAGGEGTLALTWRSSGRGRTRAQAAYVGPGEANLTSARTESLSGYSIQSPQMVVTEEGRVTVTWLRLLGNGRRAVEAASAEGGRFGVAQRLSSGDVLPRPRPLIAVNSRGEQFVAWNSRDPRPPISYSVIESAKASSRTGRFGRTLDVLRARTNINESAGEAKLYRAANGAMLAAVRRDRGEPDAPFFGGSPYAWDLRSYAER
jgi:hypothetical protein